MYYKLKRIWLRYIPIAIAILCFLFCLTGCMTLFNQPTGIKPARLGEFSSIHQSLSMLPEPEEKIVAAVYKFRDQTGQYKATEMGTSWSTAITQGATTMLLQSLEESGWFITIEREGLSNLLNERRIIRSSREQYLDEEEKGSTVLPPLLFGGVMLEGGIISFESNVFTGGTGLRYFGAGASGEYREDKVTVYLRAVSTSNGRILKTVHTSKTILSQKVSMGLFRFVSLQRLMEAEMGYTFNEPSSIALQEALDKAVQSLIIEGILSGLWQVKDTADMQHQAISNYQREKESNLTLDYLGNSTGYQFGRSYFSLGIGASAMIYDGDYKGEKPKPGVALQVGFAENARLSGYFNAGLGQVHAKGISTREIGYTGLSVRYRLYHDISRTPFLSAGLGTLYYPENKWFDDKITWNRNMIGYWTVGAGYEWMTTNKLSGFYLGANYMQFFTDEFDGVIQGKYNDRIWMFNLGYRRFFNLFSSK
jgi:curli production assembly/transport component CsgG